MGRQPPGLALAEVHDIAYRDAPNTHNTGDPAGGMMRPLDGITVVSLEHAIAAPFCTRQLADLGARVIKVERPGGGDFARAYDTRVKGQS